MQHNTRHSLYLILAYFGTALLNYAFGVALSWYFSPDQFGVLGVAQSLLLLLAMVVGSGFAWTAAHDMASQGVNESTRRRFRASWATNLIMAAVLAGGLWLGFSSGKIPLGAAYRAVIPLLSLTVVILAARSVSNGAARGLNRFGLVAVNLVGEVVVKVLAGLALVMMGYGVAGVVAGFALGAAVSLVHSMWITRREHLWRGPGWFDRRVVRATAPLFVSMLGTALILNLDVLGLKLFAPPSQGDVLSGFYQAAIILARTPVFLAQAITLVLFSQAAGASRAFQEQAAQTGAFFRSALRSWSRFLLPATLALLLAPDAALALFFPPQYAVSRTALQLAAAGCLLLALVTLLNGVLQAIGRRRQAAISVGMGTLAQVVVLAWLVPDMGGLGAALSLVSAASVTLLGLALTRAFPEGLADAMLGTRRASLPGALGRILVPLLSLALPLLLIPSNNRLEAAFKLTIGGAGYLLALFLSHRKTLAFDRPKSNLLVQFVQVLIGT